MLAFAWLHAQAMKTLLFPDLLELVVIYTAIVWAVGQATRIGGGMFDVGMTAGRSFRYGAWLAAITYALLVAMIEVDHHLL